MGKAGLASQGTSWIRTDPLPAALMDHGKQNSRISWGKKEKEELTQPSAPLQVEVRIKIS